eukprot:TRINITY_DN94802_c0_g1_i1.p1 TRINITY_DN94802_c0_g1~~TRINITY_DN94802_c0_g1_i1.p1  ORF type:complete len:161 (+),score=13.57 TRINITY_DN94802_c0_g1_i1:200-682(+)
MQRVGTSPLSEASRLLVQYWDTCSQERFSSISRIYWKATDLVLLTFSLQSRASFNNVQLWHQLLCEHIPNLQFILVGTHTGESQAELNKVEKEEAEELLTRLNSVSGGGLKYFEVSVQRAVGVHALEHYIVDALSLQLLHKEPTPPPTPPIPPPRQYTSC